MENYQKLSDHDLFLLLKESDHSAFEEIYRRYSCDIVANAYKKLQDEELSKDIVQDLFIHLWENRNRLREIENPSAYLHTALKNRVFNFFTHQKVESKYINSLREFVNTGNIAHSDFLIRERDQKELIEKAYGTMSPRMRQIFELSRTENLSHREIAIKLSTSEENVSKQITTALKTLRTKLRVLISFV